MLYLSSEAIDSKCLIESWLQGQHNPKPLFLPDLFESALSFVKSCKPIVSSTVAGLIRSSLSHFVGVNSKPAFALALIRGLGANLSLEDRVNLAKKVFSWLNLTAPDTARPLDCYYSETTGALASYIYAEPTIKHDETSYLLPPIVRTIDIQRNYDLLLPWITQGDPILLCGPEGAGKSLLLRYLFDTVKNICVSTVYCSAQTNASHIVSSLMDSCSIFSTNFGRVARPKDGDRLILYLKDINLANPDKYETIQLIAFLQQLLTYKGIFDNI